MNKCLNCKKETKNAKFCSLSCCGKFNHTTSLNKTYGELKKFTVVCFKCGKKFNVIEREKRFPKKEKYFCSRSCANSKKCTEESKRKISKTLKTKARKLLLEKCKNKTVNCKNCKNDFIIVDNYKNKNKHFCSHHCQSQFGGKIGGLKSAQSQSKRSKSEKLFAKLCKEKFNKVLTNEAIFNGWDADVIISDFKIAVLWNGKWHYEKITKKHSVKQVQNRDKIKLKEIKEKGYSAYVIKDMGKYNETFVKQEFDKFLEYYEIK